MFKKKPKYSIKVCGEAMIADFYVNEKDAKGCYLHIHTPNNVFEQRITGYPYGYLLTAVTQGNESEVEAYCTMLWRITQEIYQDVGFANDIIKAINKRDKRLMREGASRAKAVTEHEELASQSLMEDVARFADAKNDKQRKQMREQWKEDAREVLSQSDE